MDDPEIPLVPGEVGPKLGAVVHLDRLDGHRQAAAHFLDEVRGLIDGRELVEAAAAEHKVLDIDLDGLPGNANLAAAAGSGR